MEDKCEISEKSGNFRVKIMCRVKLNSEQQQ